MEEIDALLDALWNAAIDGDYEAAIFLQMFAPWAADSPPKLTSPHGSHHPTG
jgi:hypothetical protein